MMVQGTDAKETETTHLPSELFPKRKKRFSPFLPPPLLRQVHNKNTQKLQLAHTFAAVEKVYP